MGRRLGQHFLIRDSVLHRIAEAACRSSEPLVIEIGPGRGALTRHLLPLTSRLIAIELDDSLVGHLLTRFPDLELIHANVLDVDLAQWGAATVVGNLPYYITSPIIEKVLAMGPLLNCAVFLVQREVAERMAAKPGSRDYGYLSVRTQYLAGVEYLFSVPPAAFQPPPKVDSAVVRLKPRPVPSDAEEFLKFAAACFHQKRKNLRNNLAAVYGPLTAEQLPEGQLRAEQLSVGQLHQLFERLLPKNLQGLPSPRKELLAPGRS